MNALKRFVTSRWFITLLGVIALSLLIWFGGPLVAIAGKVPLGSEVARLLAILVLVLLWGLNNLRLQMQAARNNRKLVNELVEPVPEAQAPQVGGADQEEIQVLHERFDQAMQVLRTGQKGRHGKQFLYDLPWYVIIGPPGSGKTTLLQNSGLNFPLAEQLGRDPLQGVGGTRNCDWWFTDQAVLLDTAGRYTTQDSHQAADAAAWLQFLDLLKRTRKRRPINGALVAISLSDLMTQTETERALHARAIRNRLQELHDHLGIRFPVYVLFTKTDLVAGFMEFFDDLGRQDRAQVWGTTFPMDDGKDPKGVVSGFAEGFDALVLRLNDRLIPRLHVERDLRRRHLIFGFPSQVSSLRETADTFLREVFQPSRYQTRPLLRGAYLTSATQEGTPIDRVMGSLARTFGLARQGMAAFRGVGRSYFINGLLNHVVFPEAEVTSANRRFETQRAWLQRGAYAGAIGATAAAALAWSTSFTRNELKVDVLNERIGGLRTAQQDLRPAERNPVAALPVLEAAEGTTEVYPEERPFLMGLGLYQGSRLDQSAEKAYGRVLQGELLPRVKDRLEQQLRAGRGHPEFQREALKVYLMLGEPQRLEKGLLEDWMALDWQNQLPQEPAKRQALSEHLSAMLERPVPAQQLDQDLIEEVRLALTKVPAADQLYARVKKEAREQRVREFSLANTLGLEGREVFTGSGLERGIPGLYTYPGYHGFFLKNAFSLAKDVTSEAWVLGDAARQVPTDEEVAQLNQEVERLYLRDYVVEWEQMLRNVDVVRFRNLRQATNVLGILSGPSSPMRTLLAKVEHNTTLSRLPGGAQAAEAAEKAVAGRGGRLARIFSQVGGDAADALPEVPATVVEQRFDTLNDRVRRHGDSPPPLEGVIALLGELHGYLNNLSQSADSGASLSAAGQRMGRGGSDIIGRLRVAASREPEPIKRWLNEIADRSWGVVISDAKSGLNRAWHSQVYAEYERALKGRYPLFRDSEQEATLADFAQFLGPDGTLARFFDAELEPFIDTRGRRWRNKGVEGRGLYLSGDTLEQLRRAHVVREVFFREGSGPQVSFAVKPVRLDARVSKFLLDLDGQQVVYRHGPQRVSPLEWPGPEGASRVRIVFEDISGTAHTRIEDGPWAWFRILDEAQVQATDLADRFEATFEVDERTATYEIRAQSVVNPFRLEELSKLRIPERL